MDVKGKWRAHEVDTSLRKMQTKHAPARQRYYDSLGPLTLALLEVNQGRSTRNLWKGSNQPGQKHTTSTASTSDIHFAERHSTCNRLEMWGFLLSRISASG